MADPPSPELGVELYPYFCLALMIFASALVVSGIGLLVTCIPGATGCAFPFQEYGLTFLYAASLLTVIAFNGLFRYGTLHGWRWRSEWSPLAVSGIVCVAATALFILAISVV